MVIFSLQLTTSRIGNLNRLNHTLATITLSSEYVHAYTSFNTKMTRQARLHIYVPSQRVTRYICSHALKRRHTRYIYIYIYVYQYDTWVPCSVLSIRCRFLFGIRCLQYKVPELTSALIGTLTLLVLSV